MDYIVEYDYVAQNDDELTIKKGDKIKNAYRKEEGWMEGELNGRKGLFPDNFVKPYKKSMTTPNNINNNTQSIKDNNTVEKKKGFFNLGSKFINPDKRPSNKNNVELSQPQQQQQVNGGGTSPVQTSTSPTPPSSQFKPSKTYEGFKAKVLYTYQPQNEDEIAIQEGHIVDVIRLVEEGWYEGTFNGKRGVFPSNYVTRLDNNSTNNSVDSNTQKSTDKTTNSSDELDLNDSTDNKKLNSSGGINGKKPVGGVGFGNIFSGKPIELKTTNKQLPVPPPPPTTSSSSPSSSSSSNSTIVSKARVLFNYVAKQPDELTLTTGDIINILDKNLEDEGWWKGELNGHFGVFPDNFVEEVHADQHAINIKHQNNHPQQHQQQQQQQNSPVLSTLQQKKFNNHLINNNNNNLTSTAAAPLIPNNPNNNNNNTTTNTNNGPYINLYNANSNGNHNTNNILSSSASSSSSSLIVNNNEKDNVGKSQAIDKDEQKSTTHVDNNNQHDNQIVDDSMKIDDLQSENRLTHMRKAGKQINKRPPSFRYKTRGEKIEDAESLMPVTSATTTTTSTSTGTTSNEHHHTEPNPEIVARTKSPSLKEFKKRAFDNENDNPSNVGATPVAAPPVAMSPSPPPYTSTIGGQTNHLNNNSNNHQHHTSNANYEDVQHFKSELEQLKRTLTQITTDHKTEIQKLHNETRNQKVLYDDQINKLQKKLNQLIDEIDDEKKTRLALQVELERIKKTISSN